MITLAAFLSSSMAEHSAVNRRVVSSSLTWGAKEKRPSFDGRFSFSYPEQGIGRGSADRDAAAGQAIAPLCRSHKGGIFLSQRLKKRCRCDKLVPKTAVYGNTEQKGRNRHETNRSSQLRKTHRPNGSQHPQGAGRHHLRPARSAEVH